MKSAEGCKRHLVSLSSCGDMQRYQGSYVGSTQEGEGATSLEVNLSDWGMNLNTTNRRRTHFIKVRSMSGSCHRNPRRLRPSIDSTDIRSPSLPNAMCWWQTSSSKHMLTCTSCLSGSLYYYYRGCATSTSGLPKLTLRTVCVYACTLWRIRRLPAVVHLSTPVQPCLP